MPNIFRTTSQNVSDVISKSLADPLGQKFDEMKQTASTNKPTFVFYYADWCGNCTGIEQKWEEIKSELKDVVDVREVNHSDEQELMSSENVHGLPTLRLYSDQFPGGDFKEYSGDRSPQDIVNFVKQNL